MTLFRSVCQPARAAACAAGLWLLFASAPARAQSATDATRASVPGAPSTGATLTITLKDAIARALETNLAQRIATQEVARSSADRESAVSNLLPHLSGAVRESQQVISTTEFGFNGFPGIPTRIGPFDVIDARVTLSAPLVDLAALSDAKASRARLDAEASGAKNTREVVMLTVAGLYLDALAGASRADSARTQVATAETLAQQADDQKASGVVAAIDAVRQHVQLQSARERLLAAENAVAKEKLALAQAIGLAADQPFVLGDHLTDTDLPAPSFADATSVAYASRADLKSAEARVAAAEATHHARVDDALPSLHFDADYGAIGNTPSTAESTYTVAATLHVPIFQGGGIHAKIAQADVDLHERQDELASLRAGVAFDVRAALLDIATAAASVDTAKSGQALAADELAQAQDRFRAGVASTIELAQAQDAVAAASDALIASLYTRALAQAELAHATGSVESRLATLLGGRIP